MPSPHCSLSHPPNSRRYLPLVTCLAIILAVAPAWAFDPPAGDYAKDDPRDLRIVTYNTERNLISDPGRDAAFNRVLSVLNPDIICFQEFTEEISQTAIANRLNTVLPNTGGWDVHLGMLGGIRTVIASRFPLVATRIDTVPASSTRGVTIAQAVLPDDVYATDVYLLGVHLKCCGDPGGSEDESRQASADAIANWFADARGAVRPSGNHIVLLPQTPIITLGDFNLVGGPQPGDTLLTGDIQDETTYGPDIKGDWDSSDLTDAAPSDPFTGDTFTWQGSYWYPPSRLDRFIYTDSAATVANSFILNSQTMSALARSVTGLQYDDTDPDSTSDHLPVAVDLRLPALPDCIDDADCDDGIACTVDACTGTPAACVFTPADALCDDGFFCNGSETCVADSGCVPGTFPCGDDAWCQESAMSCVPLGTGDFEFDGDVDLVDFAAFMTCFGEIADAECLPANLTGADGQITHEDFAHFLQRMSGPR